MLEVLEGSEGIGKFEPTHGGFKKNGRFRRYFLRYVTRRFALVSEVSQVRDHVLALFGRFEASSKVVEVLDFGMFEGLHGSMVLEASNRLWKVLEVFGQFQRD